MKCSIHTPDKPQNTQAGTRWWIKTIPLPRMRERFRTSNRLKLHQTVHIPPEKRFACTDCGENSFPNAHKLKKHRTLHCKVLLKPSVENPHHNKDDNLNDDSGSTKHNS